MSIIRFTCSPERKEEIKKGVWEILHEHYYTTVGPRFGVECEDKGEDVYHKLLQELMENQLCQVVDTEDGFSIEFDSTEDAGFFIGSDVYDAGSGYADNGLTFLDPMFDKIVEQFSDICFEAETECADKWVYEQNRYVYDGVELVKTSMDEEEPTQEPEDHFTYNTPRLYIGEEALAVVYDKYIGGLSEEVKKTGRIDAKLTIMEWTDLRYTAVWTPATDEAIAEAVAHGYPESMGAVAFMFVYKRYSDGIITDDLVAVRAVVVQDDMSVGFSELCKENALRNSLNVFYLGVIGLQHFLVDNNLYDTYTSLNARESGMVVSLKDEQLVAEAVSGDALPELDSNDRSEFNFNFFF